MNLFIDRLLQAIIDKRNPTVVGLDPRLDLLPAEIRDRYLDNRGKPTREEAASAIFEFNCRVMDVVAPLVPAVKPQIAFYEMFGAAGVEAYFKTTQYAKNKGLIVIGDIKRGDIGSTASAYSKGHLEKDEVCGVATGGGGFADAITLSPYLGEDSITPFLSSCKKCQAGAFILVKTSNPSSADFQDLECGGEKLFMKVARKVDEWGKTLRGEHGFSSVGAVVGATYSETIEEIRSHFPSMFMLIPGYGAQGGTADMIRPAFDYDGLGAIVNSSRGIIFAGNKSDKPWKEAVLDATLEMRGILQRTIGWA